MRSGSLKLSEGWPLLIFAVIGSATAVLGRKLPATPVPCLMLSSLAATLSGADLSVFSEEMGSVAAVVFRFEWFALRWLFGFGFVQHHSQ